MICIALLVCACMVKDSRPIPARIGTARHYPGFIDWEEIRRSNVMQSNFSMKPTVCSCGWATKVVSRGCCQARLSVIHLFVLYKSVSFVESPVGSSRAQTLPRKGPKGVVCMLHLARRKEANQKRKNKLLRKEIAMDCINWQIVRKHWI